MISVQYSRLRLSYLAFVFVTSALGSLVVFLARLQATGWDIIQSPLLLGGGIGTYIGYLLVARCAHNVRLEDRTLVWGTLIGRENRASVETVVGIRTGRFPTRFVVLERRDGPSPVILGDGAVDRLVESLARMRPQIRPAARSYGVRSAESRGVVRTEERAVMWARTTASVLTAIALMLGGVVFAAFASAAVHVGQIRERSAEVDGTVIEIVGQRRGGPLVVAKYGVEGEMLLGEVVITRRPVGVGDTVQLRYDPRDPTRVWEEGREPPASDTLGPWVMGALLGALGSFLLGIRLRRWSARARGGGAT